MHNSYIKFYLLKCIYVPEQLNVDPNYIYTDIHIHTCMHIFN